MTFKELKEWIGELSDEQLDQNVSFRGDDIEQITLAMTRKGKPFFTFEAVDDEDGE